MKLKDISNSFLEGTLDKWGFIDKMWESHAMLFDYAEFLQSTNISNIEISDKQVIMTFRDSFIRFICTNEDKRLAPFDTLNFGTYEENELWMQMELMKNCRFIFDIGANYGWYAMHVAKRFKEAIIYSFEPIPKTYNHLCRNIELNDFSNIKSFNIGFSDKKGSFNFYYDPTLSVNASLQNVSGKDTVEEITCNVELLDVFCEENQLTIDFLKCDIEGAELMAFQGGLETIKKNSPIIFCEMLRKWAEKFNYHPNDIIQFFAALGYKCFTLHEKNLRLFENVTMETLETNYFFLHTVKHKNEIEKYLINANGFN